MEVTEIKQEIVPIRIEGSDYKLKYTFAGCGYIAEKYGSFFNALNIVADKDEIKILSKKYLDAIVDLLKAGILWDENQDMSIEQISRMIPFNPDQIVFLENQIIKAVNGNMPKAEDPTMAQSPK